MTDKFKCNVCNTSISASNKARHLTSAKHMKNLNTTDEQPKPIKLVKAKNSKPKPVATFTATPVTKTIETTSTTTSRIAIPVAECTADCLRMRVKRGTSETTKARPNREWLYIGDTNVIESRQEKTKRLNKEKTQRYREKQKAKKASN
jgi:hypothetical protein